MPNRTVSGFTLVELSIVLVIIGLLVGGILAGRDLIRAAELRSLLRDVESYNTAVNTFKLKFNCLPGDCANATDYGFGTNGNGDGLIYDFGKGSDSNEPFLFWVHLQNAGLVKGSYSGNGNGGYPAAGLDCPVTLGKSCPIPVYAGDFKIGCGTGGQGFWQFSDCSVPPLSGHIMQYGHSVNSFAESLPSGMLNGVDLFSTDSKIDDGKPQTGKIQTMAGYTLEDFSAYIVNPCLTNGAYTTAAYNTAYGIPGCPVVFIMGF